MSTQLHPAASHHLPWFVPGPDGSDGLMVFTGIFLLGAVLAFGVLFFRLHTLPEQIAHKGHKIQFEIVAVLGLISLFTHMHIFWIAGLLLAMVDLPDFGTPIRTIADSVERIADGAPGAAVAEPEAEAIAGSNSAVRRDVRAGEHNDA